MVTKSGLGHAYWLYWTSQTTSAFGGAIAQFALPLIVFQRTGSGLALGIGFAVSLLPQLLFGLIIGAIGDRLDRRRVMIVADIARSLIIASIPVTALLGYKDIALIYVVLFVQAIFGIFFQTAGNAAVPQIVDRGRLVEANGHLQAGSSAAMIGGPFLAGLAVAVAPIDMLLFAEAGTFVLSAFTLVLIRKPLNGSRDTRASSTNAARRVMQDIKEGLQYVWGNDTLRNISIMMAVVNFAGTTVTAQLPLFVHEQFEADATRLAWFYTAAGIGILSLLGFAKSLQTRMGLRRSLFLCLAADGIFTVLLGMTRSYWLGLVFWAVASGAGVLFNIYSMSLRQAIVPDRLMSRVMSVASVIAWSAIPLGALAGGLAMQSVGQPGVVYATIGGITLVVVAVFMRTRLGLDVATAGADASARERGPRA